MIANHKATSKTAVVLIDFLKKASVSSMEDFCRQTGFSRTEPTQKRTVKDHWMSQIVVSGSGLRLYFQFFFSTDVVKVWANEIYKSPTQSLTLDQVHDFAKEYCNLVGGKLKKSLLATGLNMGVSLPVISRGFDRIFISANDTANSESEEWVLRKDSLSAICVAEIEASNRFVLQDQQLKDNEISEITLL